LDFLSFFVFLSASLFFFFFFAVLLPLSWLVLRSIRKLGCVGVGRGALWRLQCFVDPLVFVAEEEGEFWRFFPKKKEHQKPERTDDDDVVLALAMLLFAVIVERARREERNREV